LSHTALSTRGSIIQRDTPIWISPFRTRWGVGKLTRSHSSRRASSLPCLPLRLRHKRRLRRKCHPHRQVRLHRKLRLHLHLDLKLHLHLPLRREREAKKKSAMRFPQGSSYRCRYSNKRSSESRQICDQVSMVSRRVNNSSFTRNVRPVIIASRFSTFGSASLNT
jgi:hypothetical protein